MDEIFSKIKQVFLIFFHIVMFNKSITYNDIKERRKAHVVIIIGTLDESRLKPKIWMREFMYIFFLNCILDLLAIFC